MNLPRLFLTFLTTTVAFLSALHAAEEPAQPAASDSNPYSFHKIVSYYRANRPLPTIYLAGSVEPNKNYTLNAFRVEDNTSIAPDAVNFTHNDMLGFVFDDWNPPTIVNGWPQKNDYWTWESSQPNVIYYIGQGVEDINSFYFSHYRGGFTPDLDPVMLYSLIGNSPCFDGYGNFMGNGIQPRYESSGYFVAGTPGTTTLKLSHFANPSDTTPDHTFSFTITVPEESLKVEKNSDKFLPVGFNS